MLDYIGVFGRLNRDVKLYLAGFSLVAFGYFGIMGVLFNLYLVRLGFGAEFIGLLIGSGQLVWGLMALPAGALGARLGLTRALVLAEILTAVSFSLLLCVEWLPRPLWAGWLAATWMLLWLGAALLTVNGVPFLMAATSVAQRTHAFSLQPAMAALLAFTGSLVAGWLPGVLAGWLGTTLADPAPYRLALWIAPLAFGGAALLFSALRPLAATGAEADLAPRSGAPIGLFLFLTALVFLGASGEGAALSFFTLYLDSQLQVAPAQIGAAMGFAQLLPAIVALLAPLLMARLGTPMTLAAANALSALCLAVLGVVPHWLVATAALMGMQGAIAVVGPARSLFSQQMVSARWRTTSAALVTVGLALGWAAAAALGGYAIAGLGFRAFFLASSLLALAAASMLFAYGRPAHSAVAPAALAGD